MARRRKAINMPTESALPIVDGKDQPLPSPSIVSEEEFKPTVTVNLDQSKAKLTGEELQALARKRLAEKETNRMWRRWRNGAW